MGSAHRTVGAGQKEDGIVLGVEVAVAGPHGLGRVAVPAGDRDQVADPATVGGESVVQLGGQGCSAGVSGGLVHLPNDGSIKTNLPTHVGNNEVDGHYQLVVGEGHRGKITPSVVVERIPWQGIAVPSGIGVFALAKADHDLARSGAASHKKQQNPALGNGVIQQAWVAGSGRSLYPRSGDQRNKLLREEKGVCTQIPGPEHAVHRGHNYGIPEGDGIVVGSSARNGNLHSIDGKNPLHAQLVAHQGLLGHGFLKHSSPIRVSCDAKALGMNGLQLVELMRLRKLVRRLKMRCP